MKKKFLAFICLFYSLFSIAQSSCTIKGNIVNESGESVPFSSIYVQELKTGGMANIDGSYQLNLPCGQYRLVFQCIGHKAKEIIVNVDGTVEKDIVLSTKIYGLEAVEVNAENEDPAYNIIRKAIVMAQYYKKQVRAYDCNIYVRSFYNVDELPKIAELLASKEDMRDMKVGNIYESVLEYSYTYPNEVKEKILHVRNGDQDTLKTGSSYINLNFYQIGGQDITSPLSKNAFSVYEFEFVNSYLENGTIVNKIKIIPKRAGNDLMRGYIYINDKTWNINTVDVKFRQQIVDLEYKQIYSEVENNVWMPINHEIRVATKLMGFAVHFQYLASLSGLKIKTDSILDQKIKLALGLNKYDTEKLMEENIVRQQLANQSKTEAKIQSLIQKEELTKGEALKLVRLIKKQENEAKGNTKDDLEVKSSKKVEYADSAFSRNDSLWKKIRMVPLSEEEEKIYMERDSIVKKEKADTTKKENESLFSKIIFNERTIKVKGKKTGFTPYGLLGGIGGGFNTVDGYFINKKIFTYSKRFSEGRSFFIEPTIEYLTSRPTINYSVDIKSLYHARNRAYIGFSAGRKSEDFNGLNGFNTLLNSISSLFFEQNFKKYFQSDFFNLRHNIDLSNGLVLISSFNYAYRKNLKNNNTSKYIDRKKHEYTSNQPLHVDNILNPSLVSNSQAFDYYVKLEYTHKQYFQMRNGRKRLLGSKYPTLSAGFKQGVKDAFNSGVKYQMLDFNIKQTMSVGLMDRLSYSFSYGNFIQNESMYFADYKNFKTQPFFISDQQNHYSFRLLDYYAFNSKKYFIESHVSIEDNAMFLKRLPILDLTNLTESISFSSLLTEMQVHFYEVGYGLNNIFLMFNLEVIAAFENQHHKSTGFRLSVDF